jgi:ribosomal protein S18 acetylase RimI-like enzyme
MGAPRTARFFFCLEDPMTVQMPAALLLRAADALDAPALAELRAAALLELGMLEPFAAGAFAERARREYWTLLREDRLAAWVLQADGRLAGCACVLFWNRLPYPQTSLHAELAGVYVAPSLRRCGIARELIAEALATARSRGVRRVVLQPSAHARELYRSFGFTDSGQLRL